MKSFGPRAFALACLAVSTLSGGSLAAAAETLLIGGTGGALGTMQRLINAYRLRHPERRVALVSASLGTGGAMRALADGRIGIALAGRALTEREQAFGFRAFPYARTPLAFIAHEAVTDTDLTTQTLAEIYRGRRADWSDGRRCRPILRPAKDADTMALREFAPELAEALDVAATRADLQVALTNQENTEIVQSMSGAFGYAPRAQLESERSRLRILRFNGVEPTTSMLAAGRYPLALSFSLVMRPDPVDEAIPFVEFVFSATGRTIIERSGNLAVTGWPPAP